MKKLERNWWGSRLTRDRYITHSKEKKKKKIFPSEYLRKFSRFTSIKFS